MEKEECQHRFVFVKEFNVGILGLHSYKYFFIRMCEKCGLLRKDQGINGAKESGEDKSN